MFSAVLDYIDYGMSDLEFFSFVGFIVLLIFYKDYQLRKENKLISNSNVSL